MKKTSKQEALIEACKFLYSVIGEYEDDLIKITDRQGWLEIGYKKSSDGTMYNPVIMMDPKKNFEVFRYHGEAWNLREHIAGLLHWAAIGITAGCRCPDFHLVGEPETV